MSLTARENKSDSIEPISVGIHQAVCYGVYDLGEQWQEWQGKGKWSRKVCVVWELPEERIEFEDKETGEPVNIPRSASQIYTLSLDPKSRLRKDLESWRGRPFTQDELEGFDLKQLLGVNCQLQIVHNQGSGKHAGKVFANIQNIMALGRGASKLTPENKVAFFSFEECEEGEAPIFPEKMPEWLQNKVKDSKTWKDVTGTSPQDEEPPATPEAEIVEDEDVPF
ncbi:phage replication initiation protein, NGO0469 family [Rubellicoccus peritrichatus]|uniref:Uncharacterized protein n=1 Tax=Rubellicoccus peritrichatus TaxID=3080537 RepID=A0AAQ3LD14_9BACT|nr:hypothetical protein [Puniceicoccus sp. CR14]WOO43137.1 hypothetical protein RZN69_08530 [Puniceicoccus sp. CR14]